MTCWILLTRYHAGGTQEIVHTVYTDVNQLVDDCKRLREEQGVKDEDLEVVQSYLVPSNKFVEA